jgi:2-polyprenyl-3-methyl-5-hydroxy-6-metoxy-1,4-benzoquinol methylase
VVGAAATFRYRALRIAHAARARQHGCRTIDSFDELDVVLDQAADAFRRSNSEGLEILGSIRMAPPADLPPDPFGQEYRDRQLELYQRLGGRERYDAAAAEVSDIAADAPPAALYPYASRDPVTIGEQLQAAGFALECAGLPAGARVAEFGPGWGLLTIQLALSGYDVTAVDINPQMLEAIDRQAARQEVEVHTVESDMLHYRPETSLDAAVFFESFHHCFEFAALLEQLRSWLAADGKVVLVGEPIAQLPYPWGFRLDGLSLWSIRREGWCELGFSTPFFREMIGRVGWKAQHHRRRGSRLADVWVLTRT